MSLKNKILAIIVNSCDLNIKAELIDDLMMHIANDYLHWFAERDELLIEALGLSSFTNDDCVLSKEQIWERFKEYQNDRK